VAGSLPRQLHGVIITGTAWDPAIASGLKPQSRECAKGARAHQGQQPAGEPGEPISPAQLTKARPLTSSP
jgi:hypothetical protein